MKKLVIVFLVIISLLSFVGCSGGGTSDSDDIGVDIDLSSSYRNDSTGKWRLARTADATDITEYAVLYYETYFESDDEIHIVVNFTLNTTTRITKMGNLLDVSVTERVKGEEHDADIACSGLLLNQYHINIDTGSIEQVQ